METINPARIQYLAIFFSFALLIFLINLILKRKLREEYIVVWLLALAGLLFISLFREKMDVFAKWLGVFYSPSLLFLVIIAAILLFSLHLSIVSSKLYWNIKELSSKFALLQREVEELRKLTKNESE